MEFTIFATVAIDTTKQALYNACVYTVASGIVARRWWEANKDIVILSLLLAIVAVLTMGVATSKATSWVWHNADRAFSLDGDLCPCWGDTPDWSEPALLEDPALDAEVAEYAAWATGLIPA